MSLQRRVEIFLFVVALMTYGWFNQGGGWNQNSRFAEVRAIVDGHELKIDNYFAYARKGGKRLIRYPVVNGDVTIKGKTSRLSWVGERGNLLPINGVEAPTEMEEVSIDSMACSGDVSFAYGHFHPNKPPGTTFLAVPAYFVISTYERLMHRSPDTWWLMNVNAWLTSLFSVGLIAAAGVVLAFRIALRLGGGLGGGAEKALWPAFWTAVAFGFGTLYFPFATLLFDHDVTAVCLMAAFYCVWERDGEWAAYLAGLLAGVGAITNYVAAVPAGFLGIYVLVTRWRSAGGRRGMAGAVNSAVWYCAGLAGPLVAICAYNKVCYGSPFALSNEFQNPAFIEKGPSFLGMFGVPNLEVAWVLLVSPFRGIFYSAPILLAGLYGLWRMLRGRLGEVVLFMGIGFVFYLMNCSFMGWHAGYACGSRYLIPATAFLALPCVYGFLRMPRVCGALLAISVAIQFLFTATDAESPAGVGSLAILRDRNYYAYSPLTDYAAPLFFEGRAWPLLNGLIAEKLEDERANLTAALFKPAERDAIVAREEEDMREAIAKGSDDPLDLGSYCGPVSVNPTGVCEGGYYSLFEPRSPQARWNSFNVGEFWFPESRWSVAPLLGLVGVLGAGLARAGRVAREDVAQRGDLAGLGTAVPAEEVATD